MTPEYLVTWDGALETAAAKARQLPAPVVPKPVYQPACSAASLQLYLKHRPGSSINEIGWNTGFSPTAIGAHLARLAAAGVVHRLMRQGGSSRGGGKGNPTRWRLTGQEYPQ